MITVSNPELSNDPGYFLFLEILVAHDYLPNNDH